MCGPYSGFGTPFVLLVLCAFGGLSVYWCYSPCGLPFPRLCPCSESPTRPLGDLSLCRTELAYTERQVPPSGSPRPEPELGHAALELEKLHFSEYRLLFTVGTTVHCGNHRGPGCKEPLPAREEHVMPAWQTPLVGDSTTIIATATSRLQSEP